jgi:hypothetical protein
LNSVYSLLHKWAAAEPKLDPNPPMPPGVIGRYADNVRGLLSVPIIAARSGNGAFAPH